MSIFIYKNNEKNDMREIMNKIFFALNGNNETGFCDGFALYEKDDCYQVCQVASEMDYDRNGPVKIDLPIKKCLVKFVDSGLPAKKTIELIYKSYIYDGKKFLGCAQDLGRNRNYVIIYSHGLILALYIRDFKNLYPTHFINAEKNYVEEIEKDLLTGKITSEHFKS